MRDQFVELWESSSIIQGTMALACTGAIIYLAVTGREVPQLLGAIVMAVVGYYFGTKSRLAGE